MAGISKGYFIIGKNGRVKFNGSCQIAKGCSIRVDSGICSFGNNFSCNCNCFISCNQQITFGDDDLLGWNITIRDGDGHHLFVNNVERKTISPISIGNHVWIGSFVDITKGASIASNSVVGWGSLVTKRFLIENTLVLGRPAQVTRENISWNL